MELAVDPRRPAHALRCMAHRARGRSLSGRLRHERARRLPAAPWRDLSPWRGRSCLATFRPGVARPDGGGALRLLAAHGRRLERPRRRASLRSLSPLRRRVARGTARFSPVSLPRASGVGRGACVGIGWSVLASRLGGSRRRSGHHDQASGRALLDRVRGGVGGRRAALGRPPRVCGVVRGGPRRARPGDGLDRVAGRAWSLPADLRRLRSPPLQPRRSRLGVGRAPLARLWLADLELPHCARRSRPVHARGEAVRHPAYARVARRRLRLPSFRGTGQRMGIPPLSLRSFPLRPRIGPARRAGEGGPVLAVERGAYAVPCRGLGPSRHRRRAPLREGRAGRRCTVDSRQGSSRFWCATSRDSWARAHRCR